MTRRENPVPTIKFIISKILKCDKKEVLLKKELIKDLGADSMGVLQIIIAVERELGVEIDDERIGAVLDELKVKDLIDATNSAVQLRNSLGYSRIKQTASNNMVALNPENV